MSGKTMAGVPPDALESATDAFSDAYDASEPDLGEQILAALEAAAPFIAAKALEEVAPLIRYLTDSSDCWFDHHGGCQAHGYISLEPGETCPQHEAKTWLETHAAAVRGEG